MIGIRTRLSTIRLNHGGRVDVDRLLAAHPALVPSETEWATLSAELLPAYDTYVANVSTPGMAVSLETAAYLYHLCRATSATSVLDLGSGFSSYVLRRYASEAPHPVTVTSVDDDPEWLERTADFLREWGCDSKKLVKWPEYQALPTGPHRVVFHDLARGELRETAMRLATDQVSPDGVIVFDDAQHLGHRHRMYAEGSRAGLQLYSLRQRTLDSIDRWAVLGVR
jgi:predicted O-methyltransferase YrrM